MMWQDFFAAFALMLVFEGVLPFLSPERYRRFIKCIFDQQDRNLRIMGLVSMLLGLALLSTVHFVLYP